jgi:hypothetical protein
VKACLLRNGVLLFLAIAVAGCIMSKPPLQRDEKYPDSWQDVDSLGPECKGLEGTYSSEGVVFDPNSGSQVIWLTDILPAGLEDKPKNVYLRVVTQKVDSNLDTFAKLEVHTYDEKKVLKKRLECQAYCIKHTLLFISKMGGVAVPYLGIYGSQQNVWFTQDKEGALLAKIWDYGVGFIAVVPLYKHPSYVWARFQRLVDDEPQHVVPPDRQESEAAFQ